jgi:hypothetical protein
VPKEIGGAKAINFLKSQTSCWECRVLVSIAEGNSSSSSLKALQVIGTFLLLVP